MLLALTHASSGLISGTSALITTYGWTWEDMTVRAPVMMHVRWPGMRIDRSGRGEKTPKEQAKAREQALRKLEDAFGTARAYLQARTAGGPRRPRRDVKWEALRGVLEGDCAWRFRPTT